MSDEAVRSEADVLGAQSGSSQPEPSQGRGYSARDLSSAANEDVSSRGFAGDDDFERAYTTEKARWAELADRLK